MKKINHSFGEFLIQNEQADQPLFETRWVLEDQTPEALRDLITDCNNKKQELDAIINLAIDVLENGYGKVDQ